MWIQIEALAHMSAGVGAVAYGLVLLYQYRHLPVYARFGFLLMVLGGAIACKGLTWALGGASPIFLEHLYMLGFSIFPLIAALFVEKVLQRSLHTWAKLILLLGTLGLGVTSLMEMALTSRVWVLVQMGYLVWAVLYLEALAFGSWRGASKGPQRSLFGAVLIVGGIAPLFMLSDAAQAFGMDSVPKMASVPTLLLVYYGSYALHLVGQWRMRLATLRLVLVAGLIAGATGVAALVFPVGVGPWFAMSCALILCFMVAEPLRLVMMRQRVDRADLLFERLSALPLSSLEVFVEALRRWPELGKVEIVSTEQFSAPERERLAAYFETTPSIPDRATLQQQVLLCESHQQLMTIEQLQLLMDGYGVDYLAQLGGSLQLLGISINAGVDPNTYKRLLGVVAMLGRLISQQQKRVPSGEFAEVGAL
jgi:hypothetical protein